MKYLGVHYLFFQLPDGFEGGFSDALRALADYHDKVKDTPLQEISPVSAEFDAMTVKEGWQAIWHDFCDLIRADPSRRVVCRASISEHDLATNKMTNLDINTGASK